MPPDHDYDERPVAPDAQRDVRVVVSRRRSSDKVAPLIRWANANAERLGPDPASRRAAIRALLPDGIIGDHALSHVEDEAAFWDGPEPWWRVEHRERLSRRPRELQSLRDRLVNRLTRGADEFGDLNRALKVASAAIADQRHPQDRPRLLLGLHDVPAFVDHYLTDFVAPHYCRYCWTPHQAFGLAIVARFCDIDLG